MVLAEELGQTREVQTVSALRLDRSQSISDLRLAGPEERALEVSLDRRLKRLGGVDLEELLGRLARLLETRVLRNAEHLRQERVGELPCLAQDLQSLGGLRVRTAAQSRRESIHISGSVPAPGPRPQPGQLRLACPRPPKGPLQRS